MVGVRWQDEIPLILRGALGRARSFLQSTMPFFRHPSIETVREYWKAPDSDNDPVLYLGETGGASKRSEFLVERISSCVGPESAVFELGCNVGRNLAHLYASGYRRLHGLEINEGAIALFRRQFPETATAATIHVGAAEDIIRDLPDRTYDLSFTMAVLQHIHSDSEWIFEHLARITNTWCLTIEDEVTWSWRHFPRNYQPIFERYGLVQVDHVRLNCEGFGPGTNFHARLFKR